MFSTKRQQYKEEDIEDKHGVFKFEDNPEEYKKARKRA